MDAIDIDQWAYANSRENIAANGLEDRITPRQGDASLLAGRRYDFVLANINRNILLADMDAYTARRRTARDERHSGGGHPVYRRKSRDAGSRFRRETAAQRLGCGSFHKKLTSQ